MKELLIQLNFNLLSIGFQYWLYAIQLAKQNPSFKMMEIYEKVANKFNTTTNRVERCMRTAQEKNTIKQNYNLKYSDKLTNSSILRFLLLESEG